MCREPNHCANIQFSVRECSVSTHHAPKRCSVWGLGQDEGDTRVPPHLRETFLALWSGQLQ